MSHQIYTTWCLSTPAGTREHKTMQEAVSEAMRLAKKEGKVVRVMECIGVAVPPPLPEPSWVAFDSVNNLEVKV